MVWRRFALPGDLTLTEFHDVIQLSFGWNDEYQHLFRIYGEDIGVHRDGGLMFNTDARMVWIDDFRFDPGDKCHYIYNFYEEIIHDIRIESIDTGFLSLNRPGFVGGSNN